MCVLSVKKRNFKNEDLDQTRNPSQKLLFTEKCTEKCTFNVR